MLNCKCDSQEDKTVLVENLGKKKLESFATIKKKFADLIPERREELAILTKAVWDTIPRFVYAADTTDITD